MHSQAGSEWGIVPAVRTSRTTRLALALAILGMVSFTVSCNEETPPEPSPPAVDETPPPTHLRVHSLSLQNTAFDAQRGRGYANMYSGTSYGGQDAADNANLIDFRYQYRGRDIANQRSFESLTTKTRWDRLGLFTDLTPTESRIAGTAMDEATFDRIENIDDLLESFDFQPILDASTDRHRRAYLSNSEDEPLSAVFAFTDKNGRRGLFKIVKADSAPINTVSEGMLAIEIKIEDRMGQAEPSPK